MQSAADFILKGGTMTEEEKRKRYSRGVQLTPELEGWLRQVVNAQRAGWPIPEPPRGEGGQGFAPAYVDPRSEAIAQTPALVRPVAGMMVKLFRPGRADVANEMNRKYLEDLPDRQMAQQKLRSEGLLEELRARALGGDADAEAALQKFREADRPSTSRGSGPSGEAWRQLTGGGVGVAVRDARGSARPNTGDPVGTTPTGEPTEDPSANPYADLPPTEAQRKFDKDMSEIDVAIEKNQHIATTGKAKEIQSVSAGPGAPPTLHDTYRAVSHNEREAANEALTKLQERKKFLQESIKIYGRPSTGGGSATEAGAAHIQ